MKIAWVVRSAEGGMLQHLSRLREGLRGIELLVVGPPSLKKWASGSRFIEAPIEDGINWQRDFRVALDLYRLIRNEDPDIVHSHGFKAGLLTVPTSRFWPNSKTILTAHNSLPRPSSLGKGFVFKYGARFVLNSFDRIISVSDAVKEQISGLVPDYKIITIRNGVSYQEFQGHSPQKARQKMGLEKGDLIVGTVARLIESKGIATLIEATSLLSKIVPKVEIVIIGDGPERAKFEAYSEKLGLADRIHFLGHRNDVPSLMAGWDVFVLPSHSEGFSVSVLEAMAARLPIVASDLPCMHEAVVPNKSGLLIPPKDAPSLAAALLNILRDLTRARAMGDFNSKRVQKLFGGEQMVKQTEKVYEEIFRRGQHL